MKGTILAFCLTAILCGCNRPQVPPRYDVYVDGELLIDMAERSIYGDFYCCSYTEHNGNTTEVFGPHIAIKYEWDGEAWNPPPPVPARGKL